MAKICHHFWKICTKKSFPLKQFEIRDDSKSHTYNFFLLAHHYYKKSRIRETSNLSTDADRRTDTILESLRDLSRKDKKRKEEKKWGG